MSEKIDINVADVETLTTISGIGPALAQRIIEYRETVHPFEEVIELAAVPGISEKMVRSFEPSLTVKPVIPDMPLLEAPEPLELLEAPEPIDQPEAEAPEQAEASLPEPEEEQLEVEDETAVVDEVIIEPEPLELDAEVEEVEETAVPPVSPSDPDIEAIALAEPDPTMPEPNMRANFPPNPPDTWERLVQRRGCLNTLIGATFGAILGAVLTLALLAWLNSGSLNYAEDTIQLRQQLNTEIISRTNELDTLSTRVSLVATEEAAANQALQEDFTAANEAINAELARDEEIISYLATRNGAIELPLAGSGWRGRYIRQLFRRLAVVAGQFGCHGYATEQHPAHGNTLRRRRDNLAHTYTPQPKHSPTNGRSAHPHATANRYTLYLPHQYPSTATVNGRLPYCQQRRNWMSNEELKMTADQPRTFGRRLWWIFRTTLLIFIFVALIAAVLAGLGYAGLLGVQEIQRSNNSLAMRIDANEHNLNSLRDLVNSEFAEGNPEQQAQINELENHLASLTNQLEALQVTSAEDRGIAGKPN